MTHAENARTAVSRSAWAEAVEEFRTADAEGQLTADDLHAFAWATWLGSDASATAHLLERSFAAWMEQGQKAKAAGVALDLCRIHGGRKGGFSVALGWVKRAERLLSEEPETAEHGKLCVVLAFLAHMQGDLPRALELSKQAYALGQRFGEADVQAMALNRQGRILIRLGNVDEGRALLDESMTAVVGDELSAFTGGLVYCSTIDGCTDVEDWGRASEWTDAAQRWCEDRAIGGFPGICRVHRAELMRVRGSIDAAREEVTRACRDLEAWDMHDVLAVAYVELGEIALLRGDLEGTREALRQADERGHHVEPVRSRLLFAEGKTAAAAASIKRALQDKQLPHARAKVLPAAVEILLAAGDLAGARSAAEELDGIAEQYKSASFRASADHALGSVLLAERDVSGAVATLRSAQRQWKSLDIPYCAAKASVRLSEALRAEGDVDAAEETAASARATFERLGAVLDLRRLATPGSSEDAGPSQRLLCTFMFTDIVGSTRLLEVMGDEVWSTALRWHDETLRSAFTAHGGEEVKYTGDGFHVVFDDPDAAIAAAVEMQRRLAEHRRAHGFAPPVRIGLHTTEVLRQGADYAGRGVHEAARIAALAGDGEVLVSIATLQASAHPPATSSQRMVELKGISEPIEVATVEWRKS